MKLVKLENGKLRYSVRCKYCKAGWTEEAAQAGYYGVGMGHRCEHADKKAAFNGGWERLRESVLGGIDRNWLKIIPVTHKPRADGGHKCDDRCLSAKGHSCECQCGGKNHGANSVI